MSNSTKKRPQSTAALVGLALCVMAIGTGEYVVAGVLPAISSGVGVSVAAAGQLVTVYAASVMIAGPIVTALTARRPPKGLLICCMGVFALAMIICAAAPGFAVLVAGRVLAGLVHCTVFAVGLVMATQLVPPESVSKAIAAVASGLTFAVVLAVPLGTIVEDLVGWRGTFGLVALLAATGTVILAVSLPRRRSETPKSLRGQFRSLLRPEIGLAYVLTIFGYAGVFATFTYLVPYAEQMVGVHGIGLTMLVACFGIGGMIGNAVAAQQTDRHPRATLIIALALLAGSLLSLPAARMSLWSTTAVVLIFGAAAFATVPSLQARVISLARDAPTLAAAVNVAAFNLANTLGAAAGGVVVITAGLGWVGPAGGIITMIGLILAVLVFHPDRSDRGPRLRRRPARVRSSV